jgi:hypothetical protein
MAARRLLMLMLVLLAVSTVAAALVPPEARREGTGSTTSTTAAAPTSDATGGKLVKRTVAVEPRGSTTIEIRLGDQLALTVRTRTADQVEIPAFGLLEDVDRDLPARFDLLPERTGTFDVNLVQARRTIAEIHVRPKRAG